ARSDLEPQRKLERVRDAIGRVVRLLDLAAQDPLVPRERHVELDVPGLVDPLLEETPEALPARGLERAHQVARLDDALGVRLQIIADAAPEDLVAELRPQDVKDEPALFVQVPIEQIERRVVILADDRASIAPARFARVALEIAQEAELV